MSILKIVAHALGFVCGVSYFLDIFCYSFVRFSKEEMAKLAVDSLSGNPVENVHLQVRC